jgi:large subunit ribosomal protein L18e
MGKRNIKKTNIRLIQLIEDLKRYAREHQVNIWKEIGRRLEAPSKNYAQVNLSRINRYTTLNDVIVVPGKVLGAGVLDHPVTVAAVNFTDLAQRKINGTGGAVMTIEELLETLPKGSNVRIIR